MTDHHPEFVIASAEVLGITDDEITTLLTDVYVRPGFTTADEATSLFAPAQVRERGFIIGGRERESTTLAGFIIVVPPHSPARRLAVANEAELHLLGVLPAFRNRGLGSLLLQTAIDHATHQGYTKLILWTQLSMGAAQGLYQTTGFQHTGNMEKNGRKFKVYEQELPG